MQLDITIDEAETAPEIDASDVEEAFAAIILEVSDQSLVRALMDSPWERMQRTV